MSRGEKDEPAHLLPQQAVLWRKRLPAQSLPGPVAASLSEASQDVHTPREDALTPGPRERGGMGSAVSGSKDELACRIPVQEAGRREPSAAAAWLPGHGLLQGAACLVTFNRGLCRLGLKGGIKCAVSQISPSLLCSPQNRVAEPVRRAPLPARSRHRERLCRGPRSAHAPASALASKASPGGTCLLCSLSFLKLVVFSLLIGIFKAMSLGTLAESSFSRRLNREFPGVRSSENSGLNRSKDCLYNRNVQVLNSAHL